MIPVRRRVTFFFCAPILAAIGLLADPVTYTYDDAGRLAQVSYPGGQTITYNYDKAGNLVSRQVSGGGQSNTKQKAAGKSDRKVKGHAR